MKKKLIEFDWKVMAFKSVPLITIYKKAHVSVENPLRQSSTFITYIASPNVFAVRIRFSVKDCLQLSSVKIKNGYILV
jgi:hypothetical protein